MVNTMQLRKVLGWLGMLLPWIVAILYMVFQVGRFEFPHSISATYYYQCCVAPFMIILGSSCILLICYKGYDEIDDIVCTIAGVLGLGVCFFPCMNSHNIPEQVGIFMVSQNVSNWIHTACAMIFFVLLAFNSLFLFTKTSGEMTEEKRKRNIIFKVCGIGMVASFLLLLLPNTLTFKVWLVEAIALMFFGISWLTKSQCYSWLFKDKE